MSSNALSGGATTVVPLSARPISAISSIRETLEIKEGQAKKLIHELTLLIEAQSALNKGEGKDLLDKIPEDVRPFVKKAMARLSKSGVFEQKDSLKIFDWKVEKEITNSFGV